MTYIYIFKINQPCNFQCLTCTNKKTKCITCRGDRVGDLCNCDKGFYDDLVSISCQVCAFKCSECSNNSLNCLVCKGNRNINKSCACDDGSFDDSKNQQCQVCLPKCNTCIDQYGCTQCYGGRINPPDCNCPQGFYDNEKKQPCQICSSTCKLCNQYGCLSCNTNRVGPFEFQCICPPAQKGISRLDVGSPWCTTCALGVPTASFTTSMDEIEIQFGSPVTLLDLSISGTFQLC